MTESSGTARAFHEFFHHLEFGVDDRQYHHLRNTFSRFYRERLEATIPTGNMNLPLVIRVDQTGEITKNDTVLVSKPGPRKQNSSKTRIVQVNRDTGWNQLGLTRLQR